MFRCQYNAYSNRRKPGSRSLLAMVFRCRIYNTGWCSVVIIQCKFNCFTSCNYHLLFTGRRNFRSVYRNSIRSGQCNYYSESSAGCNISPHFIRLQRFIHQCSDYFVHYRYRLYLDDTGNRRNNRKQRLSGRMQ